MDFCGSHSYCHWLTAWGLAQSPCAECVWEHRLPRLLCATWDEDDINYVFEWAGGRYWIRMDERGDVSFCSRLSDEYPVNVTGV